MKTTGAALAGSAVLGSAEKAQAGEFTGRIKKAVKYNMVAGTMPVKDKFQMVKDLGFDGIELGLEDKVDPEEVVAARDATGLPVHGVVLGRSTDIEKAIDRAKLYGATSVLVVAGRVESETPYAENYKTTQAQIREAIPYAEKQQILLLVENVWNNFLLSPLEMARYIDELDSKWVGAYFDAGNVARFGWPEHWIPVLGKRIRKIDIKGYSRTKQHEEGPWKGFDVKIGDDEIDWAAVRRELKKIDYQSWVTSEVESGDKDWLADVAARMNRVLDL